MRFVVMFSIASVGVSVTLNVCLALIFESLDLEMFRSSSYIKVIGLRSSHRSKKRYLSVSLSVCLSGCSALTFESL